MEKDFYFMQLAFEQALLAAERKEVPVGAVLISAQGDVLALEGNRCIEFSDPTAHAEILVLRQSGNRLSNYRLTGTTLFVTLEPCVMCVGALINARVERLVYGAFDPKAGAVSSKYQLGQDGALNHTLTVTPGVMAEQSGQILKDFFKARRKQ